MYDDEIELLDKASQFMWPNERTAWKILKTVVLAQQTLLCESCRDSDNCWVARLHIMKDSDKCPHYVNRKDHL